MKIKIPGKLFLVGEYSVLKTGQNAIIMGVNKFLKVSIKKGETHFLIETNKGSLSFNDSLQMSETNLKHVTYAVKMAHQYLEYHQVKPMFYHIVIKSELESEGKKYGLGSSGAVIIGILKSILLFHKINISDLDLFKLAVLTQLKMDDITSGGDLAANIYGGMVYYERYDLNWLLENQDLSVISKDWPGLVIKEIAYPNLKLVVGWTKKISLTKEKIKDFKRKEIALSWYENAFEVVLNTKKALLEDDFYRLRQNILKYQELLNELENDYGYLINTKALQLINQSVNQLGYAGKISGAGHGDCGIGVYQQRKCHKKLYQTWQENDIEPLKINIWRKKHEI